MSAKSAKHLAVLVTACAGAWLVMALLVAAFWPSSQPFYNDRPLSYWFSRLPARTSDPNIGYAFAYAPAPGAGAADYRAALAAIRAIGTNGLPFLLRKLHGQPPPPCVIRLLQRYAGNWPVLRTLFPVRDEAKERGQAAAGLIALCPLPPDTEKKLRVWSVDFRGPCWDQAHFVLKANRDPGIARYALRDYE
jgi:hypothetical protein